MFGGESSDSLSWPSKTITRSIKKGKGDRCIIIIPYPHGKGSCSNTSQRKHQVRGDPPQYRSPRGSRVYARESALMNMSQKEEVKTVNSIALILDSYDIKLSVSYFVIRSSSLSINILSCTGYKIIFVQ